MKDLIHKLFQQFGFHLESKWMFEQRQLLENILTDLFLRKYRAAYSENGSSIICFSKDRPMQLDALLYSMKQMIDDFDDLPISVIYFASNNDFQKGYDKLSKLAYCSNVNFKKERSFKDDLMALLSEIRSEKVLFLVDDIFFKNPLDWKSFSALDNETYIPSLRHGAHLDFAYTVQKEQSLPSFQNVGKMISWQWSEAELDWNYPLSLDGHLFRTEEIYTLFKWIDFKAPNSLEHSMQIAKAVFSKRKGIAYKESIIVNNPANKVQNENPNYHGEADNTDLNQAWLNGQRFNFEAYQGIMNRSVHELLEIKLIKDERR
jgi:hypothetical protein